MAFRISGLHPAEFAHLAPLTDEALAKHRAVRRICDANPGFPCRVSLEDAQPGEAVLLLNSSTCRRLAHRSEPSTSANPRPFPSKGSTSCPRIARSRLLSSRIR